MDETLLRDIVSRRAPHLSESLDRGALDALGRDQISDALVDEFLENLQPDDEPTTYGKRVDELMGSFALADPN